MGQRLGLVADPLLGWIPRRASGLQGFGPGPEAGIVEGRELLVGPPGPGSVDAGRAAIHQQRHTQGFGDLFGAGAQRAAALA